MKKFISVISLLLVAMMLLAMPTVAAEEETEAASFQLPEGIRKYYANDISGSTPVIDGVIEEGEYGELTLRVTNPSAMVGDTRVFMTEPADETLKSQYMDFYFAYDEKSFYIAIHDAGPEYVDDGDDFTKDNVPFRSNYFMMLGFDLNDLMSDLRFGGGATHTAWNDLRYHEFGKSNTPAIKTADLISECIVRKVDVATGADVGFGDLLSVNGNPNYTDGAWEVFMEFKFDREVVADAMNECFFTDYDTISNAFYFDFGTNTYRAKEDDLNNADSQWWYWMGDNNVAGKQGNYADFGYYDGMKYEVIFDLIVLGDENTEIVLADPYPIRPETEPLVTEAPVTDAPTEAPVTDAPTEAPVTDAPAAEGGCGGAVSFAGLALVAALGACTAFVAKKKED